MKGNRKEKAITLRKAGYSYSYIAAETGLTKSSLSYHLANIPYTPNGYTNSLVQGAALRSAETRRTQKQLRIDIVRSEAVKEFGRLGARDIFIAGIALYVGEGSKTQNLVRLVNSDDGVINFFINWLQVLGVPKKHVMLRIHGYPDTNQVEAASFWLKTTGLAKTQLQPMCVDTRGGKDGNRSSLHPYGTAHITVRANGHPEFGAALARKIAVYMELLLS